MIAKNSEKSCIFHNSWNNFVTHCHEMKGTGEIRGVCMDKRLEVGKNGWISVYQQLMASGQGKKTNKWVWWRLCLTGRWLVIEPRRRSQADAERQCTECLGISGRYRARASFTWQRTGTWTLASRQHQAVGKWFDINPRGAAAQSWNASWQEQVIWTQLQGAGGILATVTSVIVRQPWKTGGKTDSNRTSAPRVGA